MEIYALFLNVLPVPVAAGAAVALDAGGFLVVADLIVLITVRFAGGAVVLAALDAVVFLTTEVALPLLVSLAALTLRRPRVEAAVGGRETAAACRVRVAAGPGFELAVDVLVALRVPAAGLVPLTLSAIPDRRFDGALGGGPFIGDAGLLNIGLAGEAGR